MSEKKHIDRLFQEKFKNFEASPDEKVWKNIEKELKRKQRKPAILPIWYKIAGVAALLAVIFLGGTVFFNQADKPAVVDAEKEVETEMQTPAEPLMQQNEKAITVEENSTTNQIPGSNHVNEKNGGETTTTVTAFQEKTTGEKSLTKENKPYAAENNSEEQVALATKITTEKTTKKKGNSAQNLKSAYASVGESDKTEDQNPVTDVRKATKTTFLTDDNRQDSGTKKNIVSNTVEPSKNNAQTLGTKKVDEQATANKKSLVEVAAAKEQAEETTENSPENSVAESKRWEVNPFAAPIYYGGFGSENSLDPSLAQNNSSGEITMSYGINFSYKVSERLQVRSGVNQVTMNYQVNDIAFASTIMPNALHNVAYNDASASLKIVNKMDKRAPSSLIATESPWTAGTLQQQLGFIEVPLEIEYALIDKKFGLSIIGGASTLFLNENNLAINSANGTTNIGESSNLNEVSFSTNIGLGLGYDLSKQFEINIEPMFKYQLNTFSENANGFKPYYLGIYTGFSFKF